MISNKKGMHLQSDVGPNILMVFMKKDAKGWMYWNCSSIQLIGKHWSKYVKLLSDLHVCWNMIMLCEATVPRDLLEKVQIEAARIIKWLRVNSSKTIIYNELSKE